MNPSSPEPSRAATGYIVLAAYRPDKELFTRQLRSIQAQTLDAFRCLITSDGEPEQTAALVAQAIGDDARFEVVGFEARLGFYGNFERGLAAVPMDAAWVALSDQDDFWYPEKLAILVPYLDEVALVSGQARVVRHPGGEVVAASTERKDSSVAEFTLDNQYTGGQTVFRTDLLELALPFPRLRTPAEVHDHWLAVCAALHGGARIVDDVVQDYVQHGANVIGENEPGFSPFRSYRNAKRIAERYEDDTRLRAVARATYQVGVGWREIMVETLRSRAPQDARGLHALTALYGRRRRFPRTARFIVGAIRRGSVSARSGAEYLAGWAFGAAYRFRR